MTRSISPSESLTGSVALTIHSKEKDLGEFTVRRVLPAAERRMVGPFVFFDHMGPATFPPGKGVAVRPHPHIGLATITYLFDGQIMHRDSLGFVQPIHRGAVNLMTAGRGIVHSERAGDDLDVESSLHGIQSWMALPDNDEECEPAFDHYAADRLPRFSHNGVDVTVIIGSAFDHVSPVAVRGQMLYLELVMPAASTIVLPAGTPQMAAYVVTGAVSIDANAFAPGSMAIAHPGGGLAITATTQSRVMIIGGQAMSTRHVWWNFVSSSRDRIEQAKADWQSGRFGRVEGDDEFIPLP